jgi:hypothetical protein
VTTLGTWAETAGALKTAIAAASGLPAQLVTWEDDAEPYAPIWAIKLAVTGTDRKALKPRDIWLTHEIPSEIEGDPNVPSPYDRGHATSNVVELTVSCKLESYNNSPTLQTDAIEMCDRVQDCLWHETAQAALRAAGVAYKGVAMPTRRLSGPIDDRIQGVHGCDLLFRTERYREDSALVPVIAEVVVSGLAGDEAVDFIASAAQPAAIDDIILDEDL